MGWYTENDTHFGAKFDEDVVNAYKTYRLWNNERGLNPAVQTEWLSEKAIQSIDKEIEAAKENTKLPWSRTCDVCGIVTAATTCSDCKRDESKLTDFDYERKLMEEFCSEKCEKLIEIANAARSAVEGKSNKLRSECNKQLNLRSSYETYRKLRLKQLLLEIEKNYKEIEWLNRCAEQAIVRAGLKINEEVIRAFFDIGPMYITRWQCIPVITTKYLKKMSTTLSSMVEIEPTFDVVTFFEKEVVRKYTTFWTDHLEKIQKYFKLAHNMEVAEFTLDDLYAWAKRENETEYEYSGTQDTIQSLSSVSSNSLTSMGWDARVGTDVTTR